MYVVFNKLVFYIKLYNKNMDLKKKSEDLKMNIDKLSCLRLEYYTLMNETLRLSDEFLEKYNTSNKMELGNYNSYLDRDTLINYLADHGKIDQTEDLLKKSDNCDITRLDELIDTHLTNEDIIKSYAEIIENLDSIEVKNISIKIDLGYSLIDEKLYYLLENNSMYRNAFKIKPDKSDKNSFYVVVFNILKSKDIKTKQVRIDLIYNYTQYNKLFFDLFYGYIIDLQYSMINDNIITLGSNYLFCIDEKLVVNNRLNNIRDFVSKKFDIPERARYLKLFNFINLCKLAIRGNILCINNIYMSMMISCLVNEKDYLLLDILHKEYGKVNNKSIWNEITEARRKIYDIYNPLSRFIFVVSDLKDLIHTIKNEDKELKSVNTGSQKFRGSTSYLNNILSRLDKDFRDSMYNHNLLYRDPIGLPENKFSFKNIHMNLGSVRWYSSNNKPELSKSSDFWGSVRTINNVNTNEKT